ncbi:UNVERIFIED_ORG: hypothetical protein M2435_001953 [Rhizobium sophorae]|uniref:hypothetical protein n=1 Tax=Rhizobium leguminosarum TaxID=384 RepID=UPI001617620D|nr:hypothetical protein [Rhizobium leguminosarum]MBB4521923.1 hypothetical protein [Rhizobium leguminosarum]MDH6659050.1 hypothetical protein [Rhizobium sophorae]
MIRRDPSLVFRRLVVAKSGRAVYDEVFHAGVNIIRSDGNSRGKSTIADLIFFSLGGDLTEWKVEAGLCDLTFAEVALNGAVLTLRREISAGSTSQPMWIYFGPLDEARQNAVEGWSKYAYARYQERESFSQVLFRALGLPEVPSDDANITMHQLLRLMYVDQMTPVSAIFRMEDRDAPNRRQAVGDLLCGVLDDRIYPSQIRARQLEREYADVTGQFSGLLKVLRRVEDNLDFADLLSREAAVVEARKKALAEIEELRSSRYTSNDQNGGVAETVETFRRDLDKVSRDLVSMQQEHDQLTLSIEDADLLIAEIERNLVQIGQSQETGKVLGSLVFAFCPSCMTPVRTPSDDHQCHLCKTGLDDEYHRSRYAKLRNELEMQLKESRSLQRERLSRRSTLEEKLGSIKVVRNLLAEELLTHSRHYLTESDARIEALTRSVGYHDRELIDVERERRLASEVTELSSRKEKLYTTLRELRANIEQWIAAKEQRQASIYRLISKLTAQILTLDLPSDIETVTEEGVRFDFGDNEVIVNDKRGYSASSRTVIKNAFHLAILFASCVDSRMKYPKFLLLDNIEDKGMTVDRSQNFQRLILQLSEEMDVEHQIIFTTSMPDENLERPEYAVGRKYTEKAKSLIMA